MRQEWIRRAAEPKLQDLHSRQMEGVAQLDHIRRDHAQVLCNDGKCLAVAVSKSWRQCGKEILSRAGHPLPMLGSWVAERNFIVTRKAAEMIETHDIHKVQHGMEAIEPPW